MSKLEWSLDELYSSFESEEYKKDLERLKALVIQFEKKYNEKLSIHEPKKVLEGYIKDTIEVSRLVRKLATFASLSSATDATNVDALRSLDTIQNLVSKFAGPQSYFNIYLSQIENLDKIINDSEILKEHEFIIKESYNETKYMLTQEEEVLLAKLTASGSTAWSSLQNKLTSTLMVDLDGEKLPLPIVRNMAYSDKEEERIKAYKAELESYKQIEESSAAALNGIKGEVITVSKARGYKSPLDETLIASRMEKETLDAMLQAMEESLPVFEKYFRKKAELLGHEDGLPFYDLFAPIGEMSTEFTYDEAMEYIIKNFRTFSDDLADFVDHAYKNRWIDVEPKQGKRGGAFCSNIHPIGESRILTNFTGSFSNVITLAHELGHGYHGHVLMDESILNSSYTMPLAETASIFCETIVTNAALKTASKEEELSILEASISDAAQVIVDIYSRFLFEEAVFERRKEHNLSVDEFKELMLDSQKKAYRRGLDWDVLHPYMWINKTHYYSAGRSYYNFPYAFGLLFAKGLYSEYLKEGDAFVSKYDELLKATGKNQIEDVTKMIGIDITDPDFFRSSLRLIEEDIERFIELAEN